MLGNLPTDYKQQELKARAAAEAAALANINPDGGYHRKDELKFGYSQGQAVRNAIEWGLAQPAAQAVLPVQAGIHEASKHVIPCLLYTSPSPRDATLSRMPSSA